MKRPNRVVPHQGAYVKGLKAKDIIEIYDIRASLEREAIRLTISSIPSLEPKRLKRMMKLNSSNSSRNEIQHPVNMDREFHKLIASYRDNRRLATRFKSLANLVNIFRIILAKSNIWNALKTMLPVSLTLKWERVL